MQKSLLIALVALLVISPFQNCGRHGTETGNPAAPISGDPSTAQPTLIIAQNRMLELVTTMCERFAAVRAGIAASDCIDQLKSLNGVPLAFGAQASASPASGGNMIVTNITVDDLTTTNSTVTVTDPSQDAFLACQTDLSMLDAAALNAAYNPSTGSYAGFTTLIANTSSCSSLF